MTEKVASQKSENSNLRVFIGWSETRSEAEPAPPARNSAPGIGLPRAMSPAFTCKPISSSLPPQFREFLENVEVGVEDTLSPELITRSCTELWKRLASTRS